MATLSASETYQLSQMSISELLNRYQLYLGLFAEAVDSGSDYVVVPNASFVAGVTGGNFANMAQSTSATSIMDCENYIMVHIQD